MAKRTFSLVRVVDDDEEYRRSEAFMLRMMGLNVAEYAGALQFLEEDDPEVPGCVILDVRMPGMDGLELQEAMTGKSIGLPVIFLTGHGDVEMAVSALHKGAADFLLKPADPEKLKAAVDRALAKSEKLFARKAEETEAKERFAQLTERERDVCVRIARGLLNKQIAIELGISEHTVKVHRASVKYKLKAKTPLELKAILALAGVA